VHLVGTVGQKEQIEDVLGCLMGCKPITFSRARPRWWSPFHLSARDYTTSSAATDCLDGGIGRCGEHGAHTTLIDPSAVRKLAACDFRGSGFGTSSKSMCQVASSVCAWPCLDRCQTLVRVSQQCCCGCRGQIPSDSHSGALAAVTVWPVWQHFPPLQQSSSQIVQ